MTKILVYIRKSTNPSKKYMVTIFDANSSKTIHFGASGYEDYTIHKDKERMKRYETRHRSSENWTKSGIKTAGFWSKWILWNKTSFSASVSDTANRFNITIRKGNPPK